jgi:hypothetical protein
MPSIDETDSDEKVTRKQARLRKKARALERKKEREKLKQEEKNTMGILLMAVADELSHEGEKAK